MKKAGMNTARIQSMATNRGSVVSAVASLAARARLRPLARRVWMFSMATVASSTRMPTANANPPKVMMLIVWPDTQSAVTDARIASGMFKDHDERTAPVPQKQQHHKAREHRAESAFDEQALDGARHVGGLVKLVTDLNIVRKYGLEAWQVGFDGLNDRECRGVRSFGYGDVDRAASIHQHVAGLDVGAIFDRSDVAYENGLRTVRADGNVVQALEIPDNGVDRHHWHEVADADVTRWADGITGTQRLHHLVRRHVVGTQLAGIQANEDGALARAEGRRCRHAWQGREQRAHLKERRVLKLGDCLRLAGEDEVADWNAATVEPHHEWRHRARGHEGPGAVDVADRLRRGLRHVGAGMELELDQPDALDRFAFDMLDAGDVEEVVLIIVDDEPFHLRRVHAAVWLGHIQDGHPEIREDVPRQAVDRQKTHQCNGYHHRQKRDRASQCKRHQVHRDASARCAAPGRPSVPRWQR